MVAELLSVDDKPNQEEEKERIEKAGGVVTKNNRIDGNLNVSRALGDHDLKDNPELEVEEQKVIPNPHIMSAKLLGPSKTPFLIIACDGIWECLSNQ